MAIVQKSFRLNMELYNECCPIFNELGLPPSVGINILFKYIFHEKSPGFLSESIFKTFRGTTIPKCISIDEDLFNEVKAILEDHGFTLSQAVNIYFEEVCETQGIPFPLQL